MSNWFQQEIELYKEKHQKSNKLWKTAKEQFPAGVSHNIRDFHMTPLGLWPPFIEKGYKAILEDVDGNEYLDFWLTHGSAILGHANENVRLAIEKQLKFGSHHGMVNKHALELAKRIINATPSIEKLRFCTTGTEATMYVTRLARAYTKRKKIVKVRGGWHGGNDTLFYYVKEVEQGMESKGLKSQDEASILSFDYNDIDGFSKLIRKHKNEIAAVVMEPVLGAGGAIPPREGFLETVREETIQNDILLIFDEIITGFRLGFNSAQGYFNVKPDLTTMGKIIGGGLPIGVLGGKDYLLEQANLQKDGEVWIGGGTFSGNPLSMVSGIATLDELKRDHKTRYSKLNSMGTKIIAEIQDILERNDAPAIVTGVGSMICIHWFKERLSCIMTSSDVKMNLDSEKVNRFQLFMLNRGILTRSGFGYLSFEHSQSNIEQILNDIDSCVKLISRNS